MRLNFTLFILLLLGCTANAQKLTGIWRGYFSSSGGIYRGGTREETYKYEIQIDQQTNNGVKGVTYSYKSTVFYGKAELQGIFTGSSKSMIFKETKLVDLKIGDKSEPCLMTCYLDYSKIGKLEVLEGTFISINVKDKSDCGSGKVYLEKVSTSDFKLEDFLAKKKTAEPGKAAGKNNPPPKNNPPARKNEAVNTKPKPGLTPPSAKKNTDNLTRKPVTVNPPAVNKQKPPVIRKTDPRVTVKAKPPVKKGNSQPAVPTSRQPEKTQQEPADIKKMEQALTIPQQDNQARQVLVPKVLVERENRLEKVVTTSEEDLEVVLYDNGTIDNDTISVYVDNQLVISRGRLTKSPITVRIRSTRTNNRHEVVVVAENLGEIPPNTALMIINPNKKDRMEIFLASTEQRNAKVIINYVPKE